ncbi:NAD(P)-dependent oxidoreductase [Williamsia sp.]|uniref:NAD(P)-dependent oxidoreductase n=1 Tax=Williamsia sp. TaxID=1872085 RepID=UPI002F957760
MPEVIGFIGAGQMGEPMVTRLLAAGHEVLLYARKDEVRSRLSDQGARLADSVAEVAAVSDILILCVFSDPQISEIGRGAEGFMANAKPGSVIISHTTGLLSTLTALTDDHPAGPTLIDAPVSGSSNDILAGELTVLLAGPEAVRDRVRPVLTAYATPIIDTGDVGSALALKLINNVLFAANAQLVASAIELGEKLGVNEKNLLEALSVCSGSSKAVESLQLIGGLQGFTDLAGPYIAKDVAACIASAAESDVDLGQLRSVVESGPMKIT